MWCHCGRLTASLIRNEQSRFCCQVVLLIIGIDAKIEDNFITPKDGCWGALNPVVYLYRAHTVLLFGISNP